VGANFELLARLLVDVRRAVHSELLDLRRQRDRPANLRPGTLCRIDDLLGGDVYKTVVKGFESNSYALILHLTTSSGARHATALGLREKEAGVYF
jgi:hypothetical protein